MSLYLTLPFQYLFGDFRLAYIFYALFTSIITFFFSKKFKSFNFLAILLLVFTNPFTFYMIKYSWIDLLALPIFIVMFLALNNRKYFLSFIFLALLASLKLYNFFIVPLFFIFYFKKEGFQPKKLSAYLLVFALTLLISFSSFWFSSPNALFYSIEYFNNSNPRYESLSFPGLIYRTGIDTSSFFTVISLVVSGVFFFQFFKNSDINIFKLLKYVSLVLLFSFIFAKQAFGNYYLLL